MITRIKLKSGSSLIALPLEFNLTPITVFVGPNNSGKSKVLMEIEEDSHNTNGKVPKLVLDEVTYLTLSAAEIKEDLIRLKEPFLTEDTILNLVKIGKVNAKSQSVTTVSIYEDEVILQAQSQNMGRDSFKKYISLYTLRLDGTNRLNLLNEQSAGDLQKTPLNHLSYIFQKDSVRKELRRMIFDALGKYYVVDPTNIGKLRIRLASTAPTSDTEEKGWDSVSVDYHSKALLMSEASDGVKAFAGILTTILAGEPKITLIDEPEAFLHPALANKLGKEIGSSMRQTSKRLLVSTHSSAFLMGCIQSGAPLNIVRLTYNNGIATSRLLAQDKILHLMRNPMLRSTGVLNGLFFESVIVTEADSDRAFYQEINERLLSVKDPRGISNCLFINAQNKQTVWDIVSPLRDLGIPTIGIVDLDVLKEGGTVFNRLLKGCNIPFLSHGPFASQRKAILDALGAWGTTWKMDGGISLLDSGNKESASSFLDQLKDYGAFVVKYGELECWLKSLGATGHGPNWLLNIFALMRENPDDLAYLKPAVGDVWDFIGEMKRWIDDNSRKGIPD